MGAPRAVVLSVAHGLVAALAPALLDSLAPAALDASGWLPLLRGQPALLAGAVLLDLALGDPVYPLHPIRLMGATLSAFERGLRAIGLDGYGGGIILFVNRDDLPAAHRAIANLVGRDTDRMDGAACRRASIESLSESLTDGFTSPLFWYLLLGLPGLVLFKVVSTMDSMVGYKTPRYLRFGWCGARLDDVMNYIPARLTWLLIAAIAACLPGCSASKALRIGWQQHAIVLGPNSGWSEAAAAGAIQRRLVGPIWLRGSLVTDVWIGDPADPPVSTHADVWRAIAVVVATGLVAAILTATTLLLV
jgi:adenosylcobinamide-phosphate synthase